MNILSLNLEGMHDTLAYYEKMIERMHKAKTHYYWFVFSKENNNLIGIKFKY